MNQENSCLAAVLLLLIALVAYLVHRGRPSRRAQKFLSGGQVVYDEVAPAPPAARKAAAGLYATLGRVASVGSRYVEIAGALAAGGARPEVPQSETAPASPSTWVLGASRSVRGLTRSLRATEAALRAAPPTWAGYWAVYRGLALSDASLLCAAQTYEAAGRQIHQQLEATVVGLPAAGQPLRAGTPEADAGLAEAGALLVDLGAQLRATVRAIHSLGVTLDLE